MSKEDLKILIKHSQWWCSLVGSHSVLRWTEPADLPLYWISNHSSIPCPSIIRDDVFVIPLPTRSLVVTSSSHTLMLRSSPRYLTSIVKHWANHLGHLPASYKTDDFHSCSLYFIVTKGSILPIASVSWVSFASTKWIFNIPSVDI